MPGSRRCRLNGRASTMRSSPSPAHPPRQSVLTCRGGSPHLTGAVHNEGTTAHQLQLIVSDAEAAPRAPPAIAVTETDTTSGSLSKDQETTGQTAQVLLFFLTLLL